MGWLLALIQLALVFAVPAVMEQTDYPMHFADIYPALALLYPVVVSVGMMALLALLRMPESRKPVFVILSAMAVAEVGVLYCGLGVVN